MSQFTQPTLNRVSTSLICGVLFLLVTTSSEAKSKVAKSKPLIQAEAVLLNSKLENIGKAQLKQTSKGVEISITAQKLTPGEHGIHFHAVGQCEAPDFKSAGPHFNPENHEHGLNNPKGPHAGDLPNLNANSQGEVKTQFTTQRVTLGAGTNSLLQNGGLALVIHAKQDDQKTSPSGESGDRIACGVIHLLPSQ